jgi:glycosyltransferase involved in cell wall biosynthesis
MITVVVSVFNEKTNEYLQKILNQLKDDPFFEVICVDGGSTDGTADYIKRQGLAVHVLTDSTRAARLNLGIKHATHSKILLYHPRSLISNDGIEFLKENVEKHSWAAFSHKFDHQHFFLKFISWYSNYIRVKKKAIVYLDHCIFVNKEYVDKKAMPDIAVFEDTALSDIIRSAGCKPVLLPYDVTTSAIRFLERGIYKQYMLNQWIKLLYRLNCDDRKINRLYEQRLNLNQENDKSI